MVSGAIQADGERDVAQSFEFAFLRGRRTPVGVSRWLRESETGLLKVGGERTDVGPMNGLQMAEWVAKSHGHRLGEWVVSEQVASASCETCGKRVAIKRELRVEENDGIVDKAALTEPCT